MGVIVRVATSIRRRAATRRKRREEVEEGTLTQRQSWRRPAGGPQADWKCLDTGFFRYDFASRMCAVHLDEFCSYVRIANAC